MVRLLLALCVLAFLGVSARLLVSDDPPAPLMRPAIAGPSPAASAAPAALTVSLLEETLEAQLRRIRGREGGGPIEAAEIPRIEAFLASLKLPLRPGLIRPGLTSREIAQLVLAGLSPEDAAALPGLLAVMMALARGPGVAADGARASPLKINGVMSEPAESMTMSFKPGDKIETSGPLPAALRIGKAWIEIRAPSRLSVAEKHVLFETGQVLVRVGAESTPDLPAFAIQTPHAWMIDIGTVFLATTGPAATKVEVQAGIVRLKSTRTGGWMDIRAGEVGWTEEDGEVAKRRTTDPERATSRTGARSSGSDGTMSRIPSGDLPGPERGRGADTESGTTESDTPAATNGRTATRTTAPEGQGSLFPVGGGGVFLPGAAAGNDNGNANAVSNANASNGNVSTGVTPTAEPTLEPTPTPSVPVTPAPTVPTPTVTPTTPPLPTPAPPPPDTM